MASKHDAPSLRAGRDPWGRILWKVTRGRYGIPGTFDTFGLKETAEQVRRYRGSGRKTILRIRCRYRLWPWRVSLDDIFLHALLHHDGARDLEENSRLARKKFQETGELPISVARAGDPGITYDCLVKLGSR